MNKKLIIAISCIVIVVLVLIGILIFYIKNINSNTYSTINSSDGTFAINFPNSISYKMNSEGNNEFGIDLYSKNDEMFFYASSIKKLHDIDLYTVAQNDKENYSKDKENIHDDSGLIKTAVKDYNAYRYNFIYTDASYGDDFYITVIWIETPEYLYILNLEVVSRNKEKYETIFENIINSFVEL